MESCFQVKISSASEHPRLRVEKKEEPLVLSIERVGGLTMSTLFVNKPMVATVFDSIVHPKVRCGIICNVSIEELECYYWSENVRLLWDNEEIMLIDE